MKKEVRMFFRIQKSYTSCLILFSTLIIILFSVRAEDASNLPELNGKERLNALKLIAEAGVLIDRHNKLRPWETKDTPEEKEALGEALAACQKVIDAYPGTEYEADMRYSMAMLYSERRDYNKKV